MNSTQAKLVQDSFAKVAPISEQAAAIFYDRLFEVAPAVKAGRILIVDTALVGRPAVRLGEAALEMAMLIHPELAPRLSHPVH